MNKKEIEAKVWQILAQRRARAEFLARQNFERALEDAVFFAAEQGLRQKELELAKAKTADEKKTIQEQKKKLLEQKKSALKKLGMSEKDLLPQSFCKECGDTGMANGKPCKCFKNLCLHEMLLECGVEPQDLVSFSAFDETIGETAEQKKNLASYKKFLMDVAAKFPNQKPKCVTICGNTGTGKTFGTKCLVREVLKNGYMALFVSSYQMSSLFLKYHTAFASEKDAILETLLGPELLVIDDLGSEPMLKNVTKEYLCLIISERSMSGKTTFFTTNLGPNHILERYGERIFSRLTDKSKAQLISLAGADLRHTKR